MNCERFTTFSFVDKIHSISAGKSISAEFRIPDHLKEFPHALCCEAVGQCASWSAMAAVDFQYQPVAGITRLIDFFPLEPGKILTLSADLTRADSEAVTYNGVGQINGKEVVKLTGCLGPMLPMEEFDDPAQMRARFEILCNEGAEPGLFRGGIPDLDVTQCQWDGEILHTEFAVPESAPFFADHFPRKPVFPGTLLMTLCINVARRFVEPNSIPIGISHAKIREFMPPGSLLEISAEKAPTNREGEHFVMISLKAEGGFKRLVKVGFRNGGE